MNTPEENTGDEPVDRAELSALMEAHDAELLRIGLDKWKSPMNLAGTIEGLQDFLAHLRSLPVGATWRDVHPDIPAHWDLEDDETWIEEYEPLGDWDFQSTPAGTAVQVNYDEFGQSAHFNALVQRAKEKGFAIHGASIRYSLDDNGVRTDRESNWGVIVMPLGTTDEESWKLADWIREQPGVMSSYNYRMESDRYYIPPPNG
jgi:hypothetical protein